MGCYNYIPTDTTAGVLRRSRLIAGMTQQDLADKAGYCRQTISMIETGRQKPGIRTAKALAEILDIDWWELYPQANVDANASGREY